MTVQETQLVATDGRRRGDRLRPALLVLLGVAILLPAIPLLVFESVGISTVDAPHHLRWLHGFYRGLTHGSIVPGWSDQTFAGFGAYPLMIYGRVVYYLMAPFVWLTQDAWSAFRFGVPITFLLSAWLSYRAGRLFFDRNASLVVAICYVLGPYCIFVPYSQFGMTEHAAMVVSPWAVTRLVLLLRRPGAPNLALFAAAYALVVLSHLIVAFVLGGTLLAIALATGGNTPRLRSLAWTLAGASTALALTAFYWPFTVLGGAAGEATKAWYAELYAQEDFVHFIFGPGNWLIPDTAVPLCYLLAAGACLAVLVGPARRDRLPAGQTRLWWTLSILILLTVAFESPLSEPLWNRVALLQQIQRPYRFHAALQLPAALLIAATWTTLRAHRPHRPNRRLLVTSACLGALGANLGLGAVIPWYLYLSANKTIVSVPPFSPTAEDWPYVAPPTADVDLVLAEQTDTEWRLQGPGVCSVEVICWEPQRRTVRFVSTGGPVDLRTFHADGWRLELDGRPVALRAGMPYGQIQFDAPPGQHEMRLVYGWPLRCRVGAIVSFAAAVCCALSIGLQRRRQVTFEPGQIYHPVKAAICTGEPVT
jgi:hypothetical protein